MAHPDELKPYTVLEEITLPHCAEGAHMAHGPCPDCGSHPSFGYSQAAASCKTCHGSIGEAGPELGMRPCEHPAVRHAPGHTVHLTDAQAAELGDRIAPGGTENVDELLLRAAARRYGLIASPPSE